MAKRRLSGVQPTGSIHIGNYLGALKRFASPSHPQIDSIFFIADLHAITSGFIDELDYNVKFLFATYLALGLDYEKCTIFVQSHVPEVTELSWMLSCVTPLGFLNRMTQYKSKSDKVGQFAGLYFYPILMAADILLYDTDIVPVGEDQVQHIEFVQDLAKKFNNIVGTEVMNIPQIEITKDACRIMSLTNPSKKMSKSDEDDNSRINIMDSNDLISKKIKRAVTDSDLIDSFESMKRENREAALNLLSIISGISNKDLNDVCEDYRGKNFSIVKNNLVDLIISELAPLRERIKEQMESDDLSKMMKCGAQKAKFIARAKMNQLYEVCKFLRLN
ncbi:tryptophan--tRNA ligase [Candidatus Gromoviella agglomerans]|uniref:tryptophan--tRNA ligase n=1 Tax=Candidatus Gromoviella agglomerans TaxID=2806609 RepID=UPI001E36F3A9|nr:tryptophan--tRNA ligase [Candidatus Gromoviella agglomerans]UFX98205.1 Tryptophan--tRNA ligase [Candidatus Gromoviella agglomerans]